MTRVGRTVALALLAALPRVGVAAPAEAPRISHQRLSCVPADGNARVGAVITAGSPVTSARVYFRAANEKLDYYLEMRRAETGGYWAVLPIPESGTREVRYRLVARDGDGLETATEPAFVPVTSGCPALLNEEEKRYARNLVIGLTDDRQNAIPDGFKCVGLVSKITVSGELRPNDECRKVPAALWVAGGAAALIGGGAIIVNNSGGSHGGGTPVSPSRPVPPVH